MISNILCTETPLQAWTWLQNCAGQGRPDKFLAMQMGPSGSSKTTLLGEHCAGAQLLKLESLFKLSSHAHTYDAECLQCPTGHTSATHLGVCVVQMCWRAGRQWAQSVARWRSAARAPRVASCAATPDMLSRMVRQALQISGHVTNASLHLGNLRILRFCCQSQHQV